MSKIIWHLGGWSNNYGDRALQVATAHIVKDRTGEDLQFIYVDNQKTFFSDYLIEKMNAEADMLLIGGGGFIFHRPQDGSRSGWQFNIETEKIANITIPIAVYGIGYNQFPHNSTFSAGMWDSVQEVVSRAAVFSVRNNGTYDTMEQNGIDMTNVTVVPDAAMFIDSFQFNHPCFDNDRMKIGLNWATDRWEQRFASKEEALNSLSDVLNVCKEKAQQYNAYVYLIEHLMPNETNKFAKEHLEQEFRDIMGEDGYVLTDLVWDEMYPPFDYRAALFADIYKQMDFVLGMRGHANIIAFGQNTPHIGIGQHDKVKWFLEDAGMISWLVPLDQDSATNIAQLRSKIDEMVSSKDIVKMNMDASKTQLSIIKNTFVDQIVALL